MLIPKAVFNGGGHASELFFFGFKFKAAGEAVGAVGPFSSGLAIALARWGSGDRCD